MNRIKISGTVRGIEFSHEIRGNRFYSFWIISDRLSGNMDILPCVAEEKLLDTIKVGEKNTLIGELRTRDSFEEGKSRLLVYIFVKGVGDYVSPDENMVEVHGFISKTPVIRQTPLGRTIGDTILAHNRVNGRSDYIPLIAWSRNAKRLNEMGLGAEVTIEGRIQSREFIKKLDDGTEEVRVAYELSVSKMNRER